MGRGQPRRSARSTTTGSGRGSWRYLADARLYAQDCFIGAAPGAPPLPPRLHRDGLGEHLRPQPVPPAAARGPRGLRAELHDHRRAQSFQADPATEGTRTGTAILVHLAADGDHHRRHEYAGEIKKSAFTVMNYLMPDEGVLPMHSSINVGEDGDAVRLLRPRRAPARRPCRPTRCAASSATTSTAGATTTSFNFEGGCYAKTIRLSPMYEPDIFATTQRFGTILENVDIDPGDPRAGPRLGAVHREHARRLSAPLHRQRRPDRASPARPRNVVFLTADAFGVLPPISPADPRAGRVPLHQRLHGQAGRHRDRASRSPRATFSACFGAPFLPRHPGEYAHMLMDRLDAVRRPGLAREHRLDRRAVRRRRADEHRPHPEHGPGGASTARSTASTTVIDPIFRVAVPTSVPGRPGRGPPAARHLGRPGRLRRGRAPDRARCSTTNFAAYADGVSARRSARPGPSSSTTTPSDQA